MTFNSNINNFQDSNINNYNNNINGYNDCNVAYFTNSSIQNNDGENSDNFGGVADEGGECESSPAAILIQSNSSNRDNNNDDNDGDEYSPIIINERDGGNIDINDEQPIILHIKSENKNKNKNENVTSTTTTIGGEIYNEIDIYNEKSTTTKSKIKKITTFQNVNYFEKLISIFKILFKNKRRILVGFLVINIGFPLYLAYNSPSSMVKIFDEHYDMNASQYSRLYSVYAIPNIVLVFLGGILVDLIGVNKCSIICSSLLTISTVLCAISSTPANYELLLFSRILLGVGGETMVVCIASYITQFFETSNQSLLFGLQGMWLQIGSLLSFSVLPTLYESTSFAFSLWSIAILAMFCTFLNIIFIIFQERIKFIKNENENENDENIELITTNGADLPKSEIITKVEEKEKEKEEEEEEEKEDNNKSKLIILKIKIKKAILLVKTMTSRVWLLCLVTFFGYSGFFGMDIIFTDMAIEKYGYSDRGAAIIMAIETLCTGFSSPLFGYFVRKLERNILSMGIGLMMMLLGMLLIVSTSNNVNPIAFVVMCGMGYIFMTNAIYSSVPLLVDSNSQGTAFGLIGTSYNIGIVIFPYILSSIRLSSGSYTISFWLLVLSTFIALIGLLFLKYFDSKNNINISNRLDRGHYNFNKILKTNK
ncbi:hypothetical protein ACTFIZ_006948 [Dictyostelium cf. discoideum]